MEKDSRFNLLGSNNKQIILKEFSNMEQTINKMIDTLHTERLRLVKDSKTDKFAVAQQLVNMNNPTDFDRDYVTEMNTIYKYGNFNKPRELNKLDSKYETTLSTSWEELLKYYGGYTKVPIKKDKVDAFKLTFFLSNVKMNKNNNSCEALVIVNPGIRELKKDIFTFFGHSDKLKLIKKNSNQAKYEIVGKYSMPKMTYFDIYQMGKKKIKGITKKKKYKKQLINRLDVVTLNYTSPTIKFEFSEFPNNEFSKDIFDLKKNENAAESQKTITEKTTEFYEIIVTMIDDMIDDNKYYSLPELKDYKDNDRQRKEVIISEFCNKALEIVYNDPSYILGDPIWDQLDLKKSLKPKYENDYLLYDNYIYHDNGISGDSEDNIFYCFGKKISTWSVIERMIFEDRCSDCAEPIKDYNKKLNLKIVQKQEAQNEERKLSELAFVLGISVDELSEHKANPDRYGCTEFMEICDGDIKQFKKMLKKEHKAIQNYNYTESSTDLNEVSKERMHKLMKTNKNGGPATLFTRKYSIETEIKKSTFSTSVNVEFPDWVEKCK